MFAGSITDAKFVQDKQHRKVILEMYTYVLYPAAVSVYYHVNNKKTLWDELLLYFVHPHILTLLWFNCIEYVPFKPRKTEKIIQNKHQSSS